MLPTRKTVIGKLELARQVIKSGEIFLVEPDVIAADLLEIGCGVLEMPDMLRELLANTTYSDYRGAHPPQRSYEKSISGSELYAFSAVSKRVGCAVYYKFVIKDNIFWLVSLHRDRPEKGKAIWKRK